MNLSRALAADFSRCEKARDRRARDVGFGAHRAILTSGSRSSTPRSWKGAVLDPVGGSATARGGSGPAHVEEFKRQMLVGKTWRLQLDGGEARGLGGDGADAGVAKDGRGSRRDTRDERASRDGRTHATGVGRITRPQRAAAPPRGATTTKGGLLKSLGAGPRTHPSSRRRRPGRGARGRHARARRRARRSRRRGRGRRAQRGWR